MIFLFGSCHPDHYKSIQDEFDKLSENQQIPSVSEKNFDKSNLLEWRSFENKKFFVEKVWDESKEQSCKSCHHGYSLKDMTGKKFKRAHWDIVLSHGPSEIMSCQTCHYEDEVWQFNFGQNKTVTADYVPKLCSQCHAKQEKEWAVGSHGKRAVGWQYPRTIYTCTSCHNPHNPFFEKKWPKIAPHRYP